MSADKIIDVILGEWAPQTKSYAALALGFMGQQETAPAIKEYMKSNRRKGVLIGRAATALTMMGDRTSLPFLLELLKEASLDVNRGAITNSIGQHYIQGTIAALMKMIKDKKDQILNRASACTALGILCEWENMPPISRISFNLNYRNQVETIWEFLDIL